MRQCLCPAASQPTFVADLAKLCTQTGGLLLHHGNLLFQQLQPNLGPLALRHRLLCLSFHRGGSQLHGAGLAAQDGAQAGHIHQALQRFQGAEHLAC